MRKIWTISLNSKICSGDSKSKQHQKLAKILSSPISLWLCIQNKAVPQIKQPLIAISQTWRIYISLYSKPWRCIIRINLKLPGIVLCDMLIFIMGVCLSIWFKFKIIIRHKQIHQRTVIEIGCRHKNVLQ